MIAFVRHGQTALNREGRLQGRIDAPLSDVGTRAGGRARATRSRREPVARVVASPLQRARATPRRRSPRVHDLDGRDRRPADRARLRRMGRRSRSATCRPTTWARVARRSGVRAARRRAPRRRHRSASRRSATSTERRRPRRRGEPRVADQGRGVLGARRRRARDVAHAARRRVDHAGRPPARRRPLPRLVQRTARDRESTVRDRGARGGRARRSRRRRTGPRRDRRRPACRALRAARGPLRRSGRSS